jgi:hypothetical protein
MNRDSIGEKFFFHGENIVRRMPGRKQLVVGIEYD